MKRIEHREEKWIFPFVEYAPEVRKEKLPLIVQLHGAGERGEGKEDLRAVDVHGFSSYLMQNEVESIRGFIRQVIQEFDVDEDRVYLTGLSMGGYGTWFTAMAKPDMFAAIAPVCGGGMAWNAGVLKMPIWVFHGAEDPVVSPTQSDEMVEKLQELHADVKYSRLENVGHSVWTYAYNGELMAWLLNMKR